MPKVEIRNLQQTVGVVSLFLLVSPSINSPLPSQLHKIPTGASTSTKLVSSDDTLTLSWSYSNDVDDATILRDFVLTLLTNTKDIDRDVAVELNKRFRDLYERI